MKGKTIIKLTDVNTGKVQRTEHGNTFQSAVLSELFKTYGALNINFLANHRNENELWKTLVGGVLLFDDTIEEGTWYPPQDVNMVGNASYNVLNSGDPNEMGSWNEAESYVTQDEIVMTYDFTTSQANGSISSVALTSRDGGFIGIGNSSETIHSNYYQHSILGTGASLNATWIDGANPLLFDGEYRYEVEVSGSTLTVHRKYLNTGGVDLIRGGNGETYADVYTISIGITSSYPSKVAINETKLVLWEDAGDSYRAVLVDVKTRNASSPVTIPKLTGVYGTGFVGGIDTLQMWQDRADEGHNYISIYDNETSQWISDVDWTDRKTSRTQIDTVSKVGNRYFYARSTGADTAYGLVMCEKDGVMLPLNGKNTDGYGGRWNSHLKLFQDMARNYYQPNLYLATINNLEDPIVKDNTKTMKVTYVLSRR